MPEMITLSVHPDLPSADARRSLASWLRAEERLREGVTTTSPEGMTADRTDALRVAVDDAGTAMDQVTALIEAAVRAVTPSGK